MAVIVKRRNVPAVSVETNKGDSQMAGFDPVTGLPIPDAPAPDPTQGQTPPGGVTVNFPVQPQPTTQQPPTGLGVGAAGALSPEMQALLDTERERVRKEEKDKLYPEMQGLQAQVKTLSDAEEARQTELAAQQQAAAEADRLRQEAEMTNLERMQKIADDSAAALRAAQEETERERILRTREMELSQIREYRAGRLAQEADNIMPQFADFVRGNTREEIEASIEDVKGRTAAIVADVQQTTQGQRQQLTMPVSGAPSVDPGTLIGAEQQRTYTNEELRAMTNDDYEKIRPQLMQAASHAVAERGIYGA